MTYIIGLAGPAKVGKSTTAKKAVESFNKKFPELKVIRYAFATPIYEVASSLTGWSIDKLKDLKYKEEIWTESTAPFKSLIGLSPRSFLQKIGTECFRNVIHTDFWIDVAVKKVEEYDIAILEDARFENEFKICSLVIELKRDGIQYEKNHPSAMPPDPKYVNAVSKIDSENFDIDTGVDWIVQNLLKKNKVNNAI